MAVTCKQIAEMVGVSRQAAASVLNNAPKCLVSKEKKEQILKLASELNYIRNNSARTLRKGKSGLIGILSGGMHVVRTGVYLITLDKVLRENGFQPIMIYTRSEYSAIASGIRNLIQQNVDALIINGIPPVGNNQPGIIAQLFDAGLLSLCPTLLTNCEHNCPLPTVHHTFDKVSEKITENITRHHFSQIKLIIRRGKNGNTFESGAAMCRIAEQLDLPLLDEAVIHDSDILSPNRFQSDILQEVRSAVDEHLPGTLYFCDTGSSAIQTAFSLLLRFRKIPEDTGIIAFDHTEQCNYLVPGISSVDLDFELFAGKSWELLQETMKNPGSCRTVGIPAKLNLRETF